MIPQQMYVFMCWKNKYEVFNIFKKCKVVVENDTNLKIKCMKLDNGGKYINEELTDHYYENGIRMLKIVM